MVDLNTDAGEGFGAWTLGDDAALLQIVTSANVACGFHGGDPDIMRRICLDAATRGVSVGAQVSYRDLAGFGRRFLAVPPDTLTNDLLYQLGALEAMCRAAGTRVRYVKAHGALYNRAATDGEHAGAIVAAVRAYDPALPILCAPGSQTAVLAGQAGVPVVLEGFADRGYTAEGWLVPRSRPDALVTDPQAAAARALRMVTDRVVTAVTGEEVPIEIGSLCVHSDTPGAVAIATAVRSTLEGAGLRVEPFAPS
jgi:5-oxoprolinase (ATP-hydrolysing) subunit A